ncbi:hypothetical protein ASC68_25340 [Devosia sp. Root105]|nr:hypothetical protein ASC68_25340 [Devosia sp. Root105]
MQSVSTGRRDAPQRSWQKQIIELGDRIMGARFVDLLACFAVLALASLPAVAAPTLPNLCETVTFEGDAFIACTVDPALQDIRLFLHTPDGQPYGSLESFAADGPSVVFAMNGGMYLPDRSPQGLYVEAGGTLAPLVTADGEGNFYLKPNGVFLVTADHRAQVVATEAFVATPDLAYATQSGPMLVIDGALHPEFSDNGTSRYVRNGVGVRADGKVVFAISLDVVSFGRFARLFRDALSCPDALYLDGFVSGLADDDGVVVGGGHAAGPIVAVLKR